MRAGKARAVEMVRAAYGDTEEHAGFYATLFVQAAERELCPQVGERGIGSLSFATALP